MKKIVLVLGLTMFSFSAFALSLNDAISTILSSSHGKLIMIAVNGNAHLADGTFLSIDTDNALVLANTVCDYSMKFEILNNGNIYCFVK